MSVPGIVKLQLGLSFGRLIVLGIALVQDSVPLKIPIADTTGDWVALKIIPRSLGCLNDLLLLTLDFFVHGNILPTVIFQHLVSFALLVMSILNAFLFIFPNSLPFDVLAAFFSLVFMMLTTRAWILKPKGSWKLGIKDVEYYRADSSIRHSKLVIFGRRRSRGDNVRNIPRHIWTGMKLMVFRHREGIESLRFSVLRNVTAILLLLSLVAQSISLFHNVIYEKFEIREVRDQLSSQILHSPPISAVQLYYDDAAESQWISYGAIGSRNYSWASLIQYEVSCNWNDPISCPLHVGSEPANFLHVGAATKTNSTDESDPNLMWILYEPILGIIEYPDQIQFGGSLQLVPGSHLVGLIEMSFRKQISPSFRDMFGFTPLYTIFPLLSINWLASMPLENTTFARASLSFSGHYSQQPNGLPNKFSFIQDFRKNTFLGAVSSIGGLLAVFQGLHLLCFGMPLFWGLSGARLLNPFGLFGSSASDEVRQRMIARYGFLPGDPRNFNLHGLSLFLSEFVLNFGPLSGDRDSEANEGETLSLSSAVEKADLESFSSGLEDKASLHGVTNQWRNKDHFIETVHHASGDTPRES